MKRVVLVALSLAAAAALLAGCSATPSASPPTSAPAAGNGPASSSATATEPRALTVFAAASLKNTFTELAKQFENSHPGVTVSLNFAGSADLATQVTEGAPADVVAFADEKNMAKLTDSSLISGAPALFASNTLTIVVPPNNPAGIASFQDLAKPGVKVVICAAQVPCGSATAKIEKATGVTIAPVSEESAVTDVLGKVSSGEADAGLVYVTDVAAAGAAVRGIAFPEASGAVNRYPIGIVAATKQSELAAQFEDLVTGPGGQKVLASAGLASP